MQMGSYIQSFRLLFSSYLSNSLSCGLFHISSEKHSLIFFFFSFVIFPRGDVLVYCNHPLWLNMSLFPVFHCYKQCCDVHPCGSREKGRGNIPEAKLKVCAGLPWRLTGKESTCQCRRHRFDLWSWKIPHAEEQLSPCAATTEARALRACAP